MWLTFNVSVISCISVCNFDIYTMQSHLLVQASYLNGSGVWWHCNYFPLFLCIIWSCPLYGYTLLFSFSQCVACLCSQNVKRFELHVVGPESALSIHSDLNLSCSTPCPMSPSAGRLSRRRRASSPTRTRPTSPCTLCLRASRTPRLRLGEAGFLSVLGEPNPNAACRLCLR